MKLQGYTVCIPIHPVAGHYLYVCALCIMSICFSTKYIGGHSDLVAGAVSYASEELGSIIHEHQILLGSNLVSDV